MTQTPTDLTDTPRVRMTYTLTVDVDVDAYSREYGLDPERVPAVAADVAEHLPADLLAQTLVNSNPAFFDGIMVVTAEPLGGAQVLGWCSCGFPLSQHIGERPCTVGLSPEARRARREGRA